MQHEKEGHVSPAAQPINPTFLSARHQHQAFHFQAKPNRLMTGRQGKPSPCGGIPSPPAVIRTGPEQQRD